VCTLGCERRAGIRCTVVAGEGDSLALLGLCLAFNFTAFVFVAPGTGAKYTARTVMNPVVFNPKPKYTRDTRILYLQLQNSHFEGLVGEDRARTYVKKMTAKPCLILLDPSNDPATDTCATITCIRACDGHGRPRGGCGP
jgi:hypothetical protein